MDGLDFQLDIEQRLHGGEALSELEKTEQAFTDAKKTAELYKATLLGLDSQLAKNAERMADTREALLRAITDGNAKDVQKLTSKFQELEREEAKLKSKTDEAREALEKQNATLQLAATRFGKMKDVEKRDEKGDKKTEAYRKELDKLTGGMGSFASKAEKMGADMGSSNALMVIGTGAAIALAAAVALVAAAFLAGAIAVGKYATEMANARRDQGETLRALTQSNEKAAQLNDAFLNISKGTGIANDRLVDMTRALTTGREQMGLARLSGNQLEKAIYSLSEQEQALGDSSGTSMLIDQLNAGALSVEQLGDRIDRKYSNVVSKKMLGLDQQMATLKTNISSLFSGVNIEPILRGLSRLVALFDSSTASGRAIKAVFESLFGPVAANADNFAIVIERVILRTELQLLLFGIKAKKVWKDFNDQIDSIKLGPLGSLRDVLNDIGDGLEIVGEDLLPTYAAGFSKLLDVATVSSTIGTTIGKAFAAGYKDAKVEVEHLIGLGSAIVDGIHDRIVGGADKIASGIRKLMKGAVAAARDAIEAHSPSRLFAREVGEPIGTGVAKGVADSGDAVVEALGSIVQPAGVASSSSPSTSLAVSGNHYHFHGVESAKDGADDFFDTIGEYLERISLQGGADSPSTG